MEIEKKIKKNYDLTFLNTFCISAKAQYFIIIKNKEELLAALDWAKAKKLAVFFLAGGSNILLVRKKIKGLVIKFSGEEYLIKGRILSAWAGTGLTKLAKLAEANGLSGLEWAYGIPGSLGGAVRGNAGAYGSDISRTVTEVEAYDFKKDKFIKLNQRACGFSYRHSIFKEKENLLIINIKLKLNKANVKEIKKIAGANFYNRIATKPKDPSAGCIFKNLQYKELLQCNKELARELKAEGLVRDGKIGVGYLIDSLGFKGRSSGDAKISQMHANFIVNTGHASSQDVTKLINLVKMKIKNKYKINLVEEIQYFGN